MDKSPKRHYVRRKLWDHVCSWALTNLMTCKDVKECRSPSNRLEKEFPCP